MRQISKNAYQIDPRLPAMLVFFLGILNLLFVVPGAEPRRIYSYNPFIFTVGDYTRGLLLLLGFALIILAYNLWLGSYKAWLVSVIVVSLTGLGRLDHLIHGTSLSELIVTVAILLILIMSKDGFKIKGGLPNLKKTFGIMFYSVSASLFYGLLGFLALDRRTFGISFSIKSSLEYVLRLYFTFDTGILHAHTRFGLLFLNSIALMGFLTMIYMMYLALKPALYYLKRLPEEKAMAEGFIKEFGNDSLDFYKISGDNHYFFDSKKSGFIAYQNSDKYLMVLGNPVTVDTKTAERIIAEFVKFSHESGYIPTFVQVSGEYLNVFEKNGLKYFKFGEEAEVDLSQFTLIGSKWKDLRNIKTKMTKCGYEVVRYEPPVSDKILAEMKRVSDDWLATGHSERVFTQLPYSSHLVKNMVCYGVVAPSGHLCAFTTVLNYGRANAEIDFMRRTKNLPNGVMEYLFTGVMEDLQSRGYKKLNLQLAPLSGLGEADNITEKTLSVIYKRISVIFNFRGLGHFKDKFCPTWIPKYIVYQSNIELPLVLISLLKLTSYGSMLPFRKSK